MKEFPKKYLSKMSSEFIDSLAAMQESEIKQRILSCEQNLCDIEEAMSKDDKLTAAIESAKEWKAPYRDSKAEATAKIKFLIYTLETRGISLAKE